MVNFLAALSLAGLLADADIDALPSCNNLRTMGETIKVATTQPTVDFQNGFQVVAVGRLALKPGGTFGWYYLDDRGTLTVQLGTNSPDRARQWFYSQAGLKSDLQLPAQVPVIKPLPEWLELRACRPVF